MDSSDPDADEALAAMSAAELDVLDAHLAAGLSPALYQRLRRRPAQLARLRRLTWRQRNQA